MFYLLSILTVLYVGRGSDGRLTDLACWAIVGLVMVGFVHAAHILDQIDRGLREKPWWYVEEADNQ